MEPATVLGIDFHERVDIFGETFGPHLGSLHEGQLDRCRTSCARSSEESLSWNLCLAQRIHYVQRCLLAKIWYDAQIFPPTHVHAQQVTAFRSWLTRQDTTFRVPVTTIQRPKHEGGWDPPNLEVKCKSLLYIRIQMLGARSGSVISELMRTWDFTGTLQDPLHAHRIPSS